MLQNIALEFTFNTTLEPHEEGKGRGLSLVPCVRLTKKVRSDEDGKITTYDEPVEMIFNGVKRKYAAEQFTKLGFLGKLTKNDYERVLPPNLQLSDEYKEEDFTVANLKGDYSSEENSKELYKLCKSIVKIMKNAPSDGMPEYEMISKLFPETKGKAGKELEPYLTKFNDAMYVVFRSYEGKGSEWVKEINDIRRY